MEGNAVLKAIVDDTCKKTGTKKKYWAEQCGYSYAAFSRLLNGYKLIAMPDIEKLCAGLKIQPNDLFKNQLASSGDTDKKSF